MLISTTKRRWISSAIAALAAVALLGVGMSQSSKAATKSGSPISIGVEGPMTGIYAEVGAGFWEGARAAAAEINAQGGLLGGRKLQLVQGDDVSDPADAVPLIQKLIGVNHIVALDGPNSTVLPAIEPILTQHHIVDMFQGGTTTFDTNTDPWIWRPSPSDSQLGVAMAAYAITKGYKRAAMMFTSAASAETLAAVVEHTYKANGGHITAQETLQPGASSYSSEVLAVAATKPQVIFTQVDPTTGATLFTDFNQVDGLAIPFIGSDLTAGSDFINAVTAQEAHHALVSVQSSLSTGPGAVPFVQYLKKAGFSGQPLSGANYSYDAIMEIALAIQHAGSTDARHIDSAIPKIANPPGARVTDWKMGVAALAAKKKIHFVGAGGPAGFDKEHNALGTFGVYQSSTTGKLVDIGKLGVEDLSEAKAGKLKWNS